MRHRQLSGHVRTFLRHPIASVVGPVWFSRARRHSVAGITVFDATEEGVPAESVSKLRGALALIEAVAPRTSRRIQRDVSCIIVFPSGSPLYLEAMNGLVLPPDYIAISEPAKVASALVHEATHARVHE